MPLEISVIEREEDIENQYKDSEAYDAYTVYVGEHRILTISTDCNSTTTKWFKDVHKTARPNNHKHGCLLVGVSATRNPDIIPYDFDLHRRPDVEKSPYHILQVSIGSHCFLYRLPQLRYGDTLCKFLQSFFSDPKVVAVGINMRSVSERLESDHGIKFANPVDLNELAVKGMNRDDLDLGRYDINRLAMAVLGKHWDVMRPEKPLSLSNRRSWWWYDDLSPENIGDLTVDPFLCYMVGSTLLDVMDDKWYPRDFKKFAKNKKKYKKKF